MLTLQAWEFVKPNGAVGVCAWCQKEFSVKPKPGESHGICPKHRAMILEELAAYRRDKDSK